MDHDQPTKTNTVSIYHCYLFLKKLYENHPIAIQSEKLLSVYTNQKINEYLKTIADNCEINKKLTCHVARHTFATTITLGNNVSMESVSKILGHKSMKTTQHYAKILDKKVAEDMDALKSLLTANS